MNFLNAILLGGSATLLAPLLIHLFNRSRFRTLDWGAMHLLEAALQSNARRVQWEQWLLLLIRCLIPLVLALALARPVLTSFQWSSASENKALALLLDDSLSMAAEHDTTNLLEQAKSELTKIIDASDPTEFTLWTTSSPPQDQLGGSSAQSQKVRAAIRAIKTAAGSSATTAAIAAGLRQLQTLSGPYKQLLLASDFQAAQWRDLSDSQLQNIRDQLDAQASPLQLVLLQIGPATSTANASCQSLDAPATTHVGNPYRWITQVSNHGDQPLPNLQLTFHVDGQELASRSVALAPQASEQVEFACEFTQLGGHQLVLSVADPSAVHGDDRCYAVVQVTPQPRIAIVDDSLTAQQIQSGRFVGTSRYLKLALAPLPQREENSFATEIIFSADVNRERLAASDAVIIADVAQWSDRLLNSLHDFVAEGGGVLVFEQQPGRTAELYAARRRWSEQFPAMFAGNLGELRSVSEEQQMHLQASTPGNSNWIAWNAASDMLRSLAFTRWIQLTANSQSSTARTLLWLANGDPWLVEQEFGQGIVLQCASSCGDDGTNMPRQPSYVPLMLSMAEKITQHHSQRVKVTCGEPITLQVAAPLHKGADGQAIPAETIQEIAAIEVELLPFAELQTQKTTSVWPVHDGRAVFAATRQSGIYSAKFYETNSKQSPRANIRVEPALFSVAIDSSESQLTPLTSGELERLAEKLGATLVSSAEEFAKLQKLQRDGWEFWRWLVLGVLALLFIELLVEMRGATTSSRGVA